MAKMSSRDACEAELSGLKHIFRSLQYRNYRLFFYGQGISLIGTWVQRIATPWLVYRCTNSAFLLGLVGFAGHISTLLLSPLAGVVTDRVNGRRILMAAQIVAMIQASILAVLVISGTFRLWHIILLSMTLGCVNAFDMPSRHALVIDMLDDKKDLGNAIALNSSLVNAARLIGPSIAGLLISWVGEGICFLINAASYAVVIFSLLRMKISRKKRKSKKSTIAAELKEGFSYAYSFKPIRNILFLLALVSLMGMPYTLLMPIFAKEVLSGGANAFGFLMGASGLGALAGAIYLASRRNVLGLLKIIPASACVFGAGLILFSLSRDLALSLALIAVAGLGMIMHMASSNTILQTIVDDDMRGRVMSLYSMAFMGTAPLSSLLAGWSASVVGAPLTLLFCGVICIIGACLFAVEVPEMRKKMRPIYARLGIVKDSIHPDIQ